MWKRSKPMGELQLQHLWECMVVFVEVTVASVVRDIDNTVASIIITDT